MDVPRLFKSATPEFVARKVFKIKSMRRNDNSTLENIGTVNESAQHLKDPSNDTSSSETGTDTTRMDGAGTSTKVPVLAVGTYHRKEAAPILAAARLDLPAPAASSKEPVNPLPHPSECGQPCVSEQDAMFHQHRTTNAHGPPPAWQPPRPPGIGVSDHDYTNDYEDPEELARNRDPTTNNLLIKTGSPPSNFNSYEMSLSQQRRSQPQGRVEPMAPPLLDWNSEVGGGVLHKNADGAYYIPSGSLRTTSSTLSPASGQRYLDQPHTSSALQPNSAFSDASTTLLKYPLSGTHPNRRRQVATMNNEASETQQMSMKKKKKLDEERGCASRTPSKCTILLAAALAFAILVILFMLFKSPYYVYTEPSPSADSAAAASQYSDFGLRALPPVISLGERIDVEFLARHMATTELVLARPSRIVFNATVGSGAQIALLIRSGVPPSLSLHDALFPIRADRIRDAKTPTHIVEEVPARTRRSIAGGGRRNTEILSPRSATFEQFLLEGRHFLTFINERNRPEPISFIADEVIRPTKAPAAPGEHPLAPMLVCEANCNNRGECVHGKCQCASGFTGSTCEEAICPVVCSGNGVFSGGMCVCKSGFKGKECEMRANWCEVADCNGRGRCDSEGRCRCNAGWTGEACELAACPHATCHDRGVCVNGTCYCAEGWRGADCGTFADAVVSVPITRPTSAPVVTTTSAGKPQKTRPVVNRELAAPPPKPTNPPPKRIRTCAKCENGNCVDGTCECWKGWRGTSCSTKKCAIGCEQHGKCEKETGTCRCDKGWNGENCYQEGCPNQCSAKGECAQDTQGNWSCKCQAGSAGADCSVAVEMHCDDGLDNDNDGMVDCEDPECCESPQCAGETTCSRSATPTEVLLRMPPVFNANFAQRVAFLIKDESVQNYAEPTQFNETLMAVVRGRVVWRGGGAAGAQARDDLTVESWRAPKIALPGVRVSDDRNALYGFSLTRSDGYFDLAVNGGRSISMKLIKGKFKTTTRKIYVPPRQFVHIGDVVLYPDTISAIPVSPAARVKCSPTTRRIPEVTILSNWQYAQDGIDIGEDGRKSRIVVDSRSIVDSIELLGTDVRLIYDSSRSPAAPSTMLIGLLDDTVDKDLRSVHLDIRVAGRRFETTLAPRVNLTYTFAWDKMNGYRQSENGLVPTVVRIGYEYVDCERDSEIVWVQRTAKMLGATARKMIGRMWTLDIHHHLDVVNNIVEMGDGGYRLIEEIDPQMSRIAGVSGVKREIDCGAEQCDGLLEKIPLFRPSALALAADGSVLIGDHNLIRRIAPNGTVNTVLTLSLADTSHSYHLAVSPIDGSVVVSLPLHKQIWRLVSLTPHDARNNYEILAGDGSVCASAIEACGDGGLAQNAQLIFPKGLDFDSAGNLYFADSRRIRVIDTAGHIRSIGETTPESLPVRSCSPISKLLDLQMEWPTAISFDKSADMLYVLDTNVVYQIDVDNGLVTIALGTPATCDGSVKGSSGSSTSQSANALQIQHAKDIRLADDGSIYVVESDGKRLNQVRRVSPDRSAISVVGGGKSHCSCDVASCGCELSSPMGVVIDAAGDVIVADAGNGMVKRIARRMAKYDGKTRSYEVDDPERMERYKFNRHGLHTSTISMVTGRSMYNFTYSVDSPNAILSSMNGASGITVRVNRLNESILELQTSAGETSLLTMSAYDGTLEMVSRKAATPSPNTRDVTKLAYSTSGMLVSKTDLAEAVFFEYDTKGRAVGLRMDGEYWQIGEEVIATPGRACTDVYLNGDRVMSVRLGEGDLAIWRRGEPASTRLITLRREGYSLTTPSGTATLFDKSLDGHSVSRRRTTVPSIGDPQRRALTTRWDWRYVKKKNGGGGRGGARRMAEVVDFRPRINGVNMFSMEYDVAANRDTLRVGSATDDTSSALLHVDYTDSGRIRRIGAVGESSLAPLNLTWDSNGRLSAIQWGLWRRARVYDASNRLVEIVDEAARVPVKLAYNGGASRRPNSIHHDGATWNVQYDNYERVKEVSAAASGETSAFSAIALGGDWVLKRRTPLNTRPNMIRVDGATREIVEFASADGNHHWMQSEKMILNDGREMRIGCFSKIDGRPMCVESDELVQNVTMQGHLIARSSVSIRSASSASFTYEYDDLLRVIAIHPIIDQSVLQPIQITYDERFGRVSSLNGFQLIRDATTIRCQGNGVLYETTSGNDAHRQVVERKMMMGGDLRAVVRIERDAVGRASSTIVETAEISRITRTFDAAGRVASVEDAPGQKIRIDWNSDGRVEKIDDRIVEWHRGGAIKQFEGVEYTNDAIGWVRSRGGLKFAYDGKGRVVEVKSNDSTYTIRYDHLDRVVGLSDGRDATWSLFYAYVDKPRLVSHFVKKSGVSTVTYDDHDVPFAITSSDGRIEGLICDETRAMKVRLDASNTVQVIRRSIFGALRSGVDEPFLPVGGFLGGIELVALNISILPNGRPLDLVTGRYLTVSPAAVNRLDLDEEGYLANSLDLLALERFNDPYAIPEIPIDFNSWFELVGLSPSFLPSAHLGLPRGNDTPVAHRLLASFPRKLHALEHLTTMQPTRLVATRPRSSTEWSIEDIGFANMLMVNRGRDSRVDTALLPILSDEEARVVREVLRDAQWIGVHTWSPIPTRHLWRRTRGDAEINSAAYPHFTLVVNKESVEMRNGKSKIVVHYGPNKDGILGDLTQEMRGRESISVWKAERKRLENGEMTWNRWNDREQRELKSKGTVSGYELAMKPSYRQAIFPTIHSWKFTPK